MTARIGRLTFPGPIEAHTIAPGEITVSGLLDTGTSAAAMHYAAQLALVGNPDEPIVPVTVTDGWSGYGRVTSTSFAPLLLTRGLARYSVAVEPIGRNPQITSALTATVRTNAHSITTAAPIHAVPAAATQWSWLPTATAQQETRLTAPGPAGGDVLYRRVATGTGATTARWTGPPDAFLAGACSVETRVAGAWLPVVGRTALDAPWRVTNGLVGVTLNDSGRLAVEWWRADNAGWTPTIEYGIGAGGGFDYTAWTGVEITSLTAHAVTLRAQGVRSQGRATLWLSLRRGSRVVSGTVDVDVLPGHRLRPVPATAVTDGTSHAYLGSDVADSGGLRWLIAAADAAGIDTSDGEVTPANALATSWSWGIGGWFNGASGDSGSRTQTALDWYASQSEAVSFS